MRVAALPTPQEIPLLQCRFVQRRPPPATHQDQCARLFLERGRTHKQPLMCVGTLPVRRTKGNPHERASTFVSCVAMFQTSVATGIESVEPEAVAHGGQQRLGACCDAECPEDLVRVVLDGIFGNFELVGDLPVGEPLRYASQHLDLPFA